MHATAARGNRGPRFRNLGLLLALGFGRATATETPLPAYSVQVAYLDGGQIIPLLPAMAVAWPPAALR
jgi:hypothetical protein